jgi:putative phage-type endonuclease
MQLTDLGELQNIIDDIEVNQEYFDYDEEIELFENCLQLIDDYILENPKAITEKDFDETIFEEVQEMLLLEIENILNDNIWLLHDDIEDDLDDIIISAIEYYFEYISPSRMSISSNNNSIKTVEGESLTNTLPNTLPNTSNIETIKNKIIYLESKPQPVQRTPEWYHFRHNLITASNAYKAFESQSSKNQLIYEKCKPITYGEDKKQSVNVSSSLHWGQKYEPISVMVYEHKYNSKIQDFGCIQHDRYKFLGASPDGINVDETSALYGRMLEIKNPVSRDITGIPKKEYWIQCQLQMETCDLDECDFYETKFTEYETENDFLQDGQFLLSAKNEMKGIMMYFSTIDGFPHYIYKPIAMEKEEYDLWEQETIELYENDKNMTWIKNNYWKLEQVSCVLILRNKQWFETNIEEVATLWKTIEEERITGYEHRAPKVRANQSNQSNQSNQIIQVNKITNYLNINTSTGLTLGPGSGSGCLLNFQKNKETGAITVVKKIN